MIEEQILHYINESVRPLTEEEIAHGLSLDSVEDLVGMKKALLQLEQKGRVSSDAQRQARFAGAVRVTGWQNYPPSAGIRLFGDGGSGDRGYIYRLCGVKGCAARGQGYCAR